MAELNHRLLVDCGLELTAIGQSASGFLQGAFYGRIRMNSSCSSKCIKHYGIYNYKFMFIITSRLLYSGLGMVRQVTRNASLFQVKNIPSRHPFLSS